MAEGVTFVLMDHDGTPLCAEETEDPADWSAILWLYVEWKGYDRDPERYVEARLRGQRLAADG